jgi:UPF0716 protein FxsA
MSRIFPLFILLLWPLAEIAGFVVVGRALGLWWTLGLVILTGLMGAYLLRRQGLHLLQTLSKESQQGQIPASSVVNGAMIVVAGIFLLLPGFITDILGLALFIPVVRQLLWSRVGKRFVTVRTSARGGFGRGPGPGPGPSRDGPSSPAGTPGKVLDLDEDEFRRDGEPNASSPWAKDEDRDR